MTAIHEQIPFVYSVINKIRRDAFLTYYRMKHPGASPTDIFTLYYNRNLFGDPESRSGTGSSLQATRNLRPELSATFERFGIESVLDVPCGDFNWMKALDWSRITYLGGDIVEDMIRKNQAEHGSGNISFQVLDILQGNLPTCDLVICRDLFIHFDNRSIATALRRISESKPKLVGLTQFNATRANKDIRIGSFRPVNLMAAPFNLPPPVHVIKDTDYIDIWGKTLSFWTPENFAGI
jgi:SAM-dependent methyltransferase